MPHTRKKILLVVGTRPEAIKMAPVYLALSGSNALQPIWLSTGQHREMLRQTINAFGIRPDHDLDLMTAGQSLPELQAVTLTSISAYLNANPVCAVLAQGDTTTVLSAAIAAFYARTAFGHVEAGLRTGNMEAPWPEEMNRRLVSPTCRWHFAPTQASSDNLIREGISPELIYVTGNTVIDALLYISKKLQESPPDIDELARRLSISEVFTERYLKVSEAAWILVTGHRRESFGKGMEDICQAILEITKRRESVGIVYPAHLNPKVQEPVRRLLQSSQRIALASPASYEDFVWLMGRCRLVLTDSGGVQEECPSLGKPALVMRDTTERPESIIAGTCELVGTKQSTIVDRTLNLLDNPSECQKRGSIANPYGSGRAAEVIVNILENSLA